MTPGRTATPLVAGVALLERAVGYTLGSLLLVTAEDLPRSTPCRGWDLDALLDHMNDSLAALHEAVTGGRVVLRPVDRRHAIDGVATLRARACQLLGDWSRAERTAEAVSVAGRPVDSVLVAVTGAVEVAVHGWDVAQACGRPRPIPSGLAEELLELAPWFVTTADRPGRFAPAVRLSPGASAGDRLVAFLGRVPS